MHPYSNLLLQSSLAQGLDGPQRASTGPISLTGTHNSPLSEQAFGPGKTYCAAPEDYAHTPEHLEEDFEEISYDELRLSICAADPAYFAAVFGADYQPVGRNHSLLSRSRSSISRLGKLSRNSLRRPQGTRPRAKSVRTLLEDPARARTPSFDLPQSSSSSSSSSTTSRASRSPDTPPTLAAQLPLGSDAAPQADSSREQETSQTAYTAEEVTVETDSLAVTRAATPPSPKAKSFTSSLKRLRTLSRPSLFGARRHAPQVCQVLPAESSRPSRPRSSTSTAAEPVQLPELVFDQVDFSLIVQDDPPTPLASSASASTNLDEPPALAPPLPRIEITTSGPRLRSASLQLPRIQFVDPGSLTASAPASAVDRISPFWSAPPSPAWLSRNVDNVEPAASSSPLPLPIPPPPSPPLFIVPRSLRPDSYYLRQPENEFTTAPQTPRSTSSSVTLCSPSRRGSFLAPPSPVGSRPTTTNRISVTYRHSLIDDRQSVHPVVTLSEEYKGQIITNTSLNVFCLPSDPSSLPPSPLTPLALDNSLVCFPNPALPSPVVTESENSPYAIFTPAADAHEYSEAVHFRPPTYLVNFVKKILHTSTVCSSMDISNKQTDTVDWGGEVDYSGYEWFKDPPPRPEPPPPEPTLDNYVPQPGVIEQNEAFDFALKSAPNVLYARFKQFGQLGVLAWCSEFSELIDALKHLGFDGNMFVSTRTQALKTCEDILKLNLEIEMQIIVMYLSSQVARLRRFLDSDRQWDDYPKPKFPLDPNEYPKQ